MKFKVFRQLEAMDCGVACAQMIAYYYGCFFTIRTLKKACDITKIGVTIKDVISICQNIRLNAVAVKAKMKDIQSMPLPAILYWRQNHYVILYKITKRKKGYIFYIADPAYGKIKLSETAFEQEWINELSGIAILVEPSSSFGELQSEKEDYWKHFLIYLKKIKENLPSFKKEIFLISILSVLIAAFNWVIPFLFQNAIDVGIGNKEINIVIVYMLLQVIFYLGSTLSEMVSNILLTKIGFKFSIRFLTDYLIKLVSLPISFYETKIHTDLMLRMDDYRKVEGFLTISLRTFVFSSITFLIYSIILLQYHVLIYLVFLLFTALSFLFTKLYLNRLKYINYERFSLQTENKNLVYEIINGMIEIKINNAQNVKVDEWRCNQNKLNKVVLKTAYIDNQINLGTTTLNRLTHLVIMLLCSYLVIQTNLTLGAMMTIVYVLGQLSTSTGGIINFVRIIQDVKLSLDRLEEIQQKENEVDAYKKDVDKVQFDQIVLENVSFKYAGTFNNYVLRNVDVKIPVNKVTAIVGASGSGKTTLMKLLLSFYYPQLGDILVGDEKLCNFDVNLWRNKCGIVMQDGYIFSGSIANNIVMSELDFDLNRVKRAAKIACVDDFIEKLPMKYNTKIGKTGIGLSGGQIQRILIARAVYKNPRFIFFDEATSCLDSRNEKQIMDNLNEFFKDKTVVIIAHRLSTVTNADNIIYLDNGIVVEQGNHHQLVEKKGAYYELIRNQLELGNK